MRIRAADEPITAANSGSRALLSQRVIRCESVPFLWDYEQGKVSDEKDLLGDKVDGHFISGLQVWRNKYADSDTPACFNCTNYPGRCRI